MFPNDTIPAIDPVAAAILAKIPMPTPGLVGSNNLNITAVSTTNVNQYNARIDHTFGTNDNVFVRASVFDANRFLPFGSAALNEALFPAFGYNLRTHTDNLSATWSHIFNTSWINELRFGWMWVGGGESSPNAGTDFAGQTGLQGASANPLDTGYPAVTLTGFSTMGESTQYVSRKDNDYELYDNVMWHHGTHTVKFGGYFFHLDFEPVNAKTPEELLLSPGNLPATRWAIFCWERRIRERPGSGDAGISGAHQLGALYIEDGWQITPSLKLDIGLRYEYNQNVTDVNNNMAIVNTLVPGGEFVIASDDQRPNFAGGIRPAGDHSAIPVVTSTDAGME